MQEPVRVAIEEIEVDGSARILIHPKTSQHDDSIYRAAAGVRWLREARAFVPLCRAEPPASAYVAFFVLA